MSDYELFYGKMKNDSAESQPDSRDEQIAILAAKCNDYVDTIIVLQEQIIREQGEIAALKDQLANKEAS